MLEIPHQGSRVEERDGRDTQAGHERTSLTNWRRESGGGEE